MHKGIILGIIGAIIVFLVSYSVIIYSNSDFDTQLINKVNDGEQPSTLLIQIDSESQRMKKNVDRRYLSNVMDRKHWGNGDLANRNDYNYYTGNYENDLKNIKELENYRKQFVKKEINRDQFLASIIYYKEYFKIY